MCGIVGYVGTKSATPILLEGLRRLEYRGYDSAGIAVLSGAGELQVKKATGKLHNLRTAVGTIEPEGSVGIGHTRWATHGRPSDDNAHPHTDCHGDITVVHNGIIENYAELRDELQAKGHTFRSETDTEILAHLLEDLLPTTASLAEAARLALQRVTGSYAIAVVSRAHPGHIVGARLNGPLIIGLGDGENFLASDIPAILKHTRSIIILEEGEVADVTPTSVTLTDLNGAAIARAPIQVDWDAEAAEKGGYPHFFVKEIHEQPQALRRALLGRVVERPDGLALRLEALDKLAATGALDKMRRAVLLGCGTSIHAALLAKYAMERWARLPVEVSIASEYRYADPIVGPDTLCIAVTQSGETADTLAATRLAREMGAPVVAVTNVVGSAITRVADAVLYLQAGPEISVTATKTFVTMTTVLYLAGLWLGRHSGQLVEVEERQMLAALQTLPGQMERVLETMTAAEGPDGAIGRVAARLAGCHSCMFIGRGPGFPLALEGALKLKEISYVHAEAYPAGELKHGPIALLDPTVPLIADATTGHTYEKVISNIQEVRARDAHVIAIATEGDGGIQRHADEVFYVPAAPEILAPILAIVPLQLISYHVALARGCNVDQPRNLAKSVTVE
ncbi:MAG: glutamine--fructose-6-phosphate transaminase (isomerizing) [Ktedonobacterales bacterium]|nr:glutamine--fructose-6-phosphate transaminase (isomerizing) [Ktedonobacterales bacterium]